MTAGIDVATRGTRRATTTPLRARLRSAGVWIVAAVVVLVAVILTMLMTGSREASDPLHYDSTARDGMKALVETLSDHGTEVTTTEDVAAARAAAARPGTTLLIPTGTDLLSESEVAGLTSALSTGGNRLVLVDPGPGIAAFTTRIELAPDAPLAQPDPVSQPDCTLPAARAAGDVSTGQSLYTPTEEAANRVLTCYPFSGPGVTDAAATGQLVVDDGGRFPLTVLGSPEWVSNGTITENGNAALALSTLSAEERLVVLYPRPDPGDAAPPSTLDYLPDWFVAGALWLLPCLLVGLLVIGRRFGPLALERLPVIVPAIETVRGRAALAQRSHDRSGALHALRTAALLSIARRLALGPEVGEAEILSRIAAATGRDPAQLAHAFTTGQPADDRELTELSELISTIESEIP